MGRSLLSEIDIEAIWQFVGTTAQATILVCLMIHMWLSRKAKRFTLPAAVIYICLLSTGLLAVYAAYRRDFVFVSGQIVNIVIGLRILAARYQAARSGAGDFPVVAPDRAEPDSEIGIRR